MRRSINQKIDEARHIICKGGSVDEANFLILEVLEDMNNLWVAHDRGMKRMREAAETLTLRSSKDYI